MTKHFNCKKCAHSCETRIRAERILKGKCDRFERIEKAKPRIIFLDAGFEDRFKKIKA